MSNTLQQHHFNGIIYYAWQTAAMEIQLKTVRKTENDLEKVLESHITSQDVRQALKQNKSIREETRGAGDKLVIQYELTLLKAQEYRLNIEKDLNQAKSVLRSYLSNYADDRVRFQILQLISKSKRKLEVFNFNRNPFWIDHSAYEVFTETLASSLNETYKHKFTYNAPPSNHFLISLLSHPLVRGLNSVSTLLGLAALTVGILAFAGIITGLPISAVSVLIAGGTILGINGVSLLTCSFFRHPSPEELASRSEKISIPEINDSPVLSNVKVSSNDDLFQDKPTPIENNVIKINV